MNAQARCTNPSCKLTCRSNRVTAPNGDELFVDPTGEPGPTFWEWRQAAGVGADSSGEDELRRRWMRGEPPACALPAFGVECRPLGALPLARVAGFPADVLAACEAAGVRTLFDLEARVEEVKRSHPDPTHYGADGRPVHEALRRVPGVRDLPGLFAAGDAVIDHLHASGRTRPRMEPRPEKPARKKRSRPKAKAAGGAK